MRGALITSIVLLATTTAFSSAFAGQIEPNFAAYLETIGTDDFTSAIVYLNDRPNIRALDNALRAERATMAVRHARVLDTLHQAAERSQPALLNYLDAKKADGLVEGYTPYWIMNLVVVSATKGELLKIAHRADVEAIEGNFKAVMIEPVGKPFAGSPIAGIGVTNSLTAINADRVWYELGITGNGTLVANMDTGVEGTHPALSARWRGNSHPWQECWRDALGGGTTFPSDGNGHGTHTMGTMCGAGHGTGDTVGVAFNAQWIADNSINQGVSPEFDNDVLSAFQWFADPDGNPGTTDDVPDVLQNSWGVDARFGGDYQDCDHRWQAAIDNCEAAGVVVTFSAGNEGPSSQTNRSPANVCNTPTVNFSVGAVDAENYGWPYPIAYFSSRGPSDCDGTTIKPEVSAPGYSVYSSYPGGGYIRMSGTSMAGPHVAGVVALMREANPNVDVQTIKEILMSTARDLGPNGEDNDFGWGVIDAYAAVMAVMEPDTEPPVVSVTAPNGGETLDVGTAYAITWNATDNVGISSTSLYYSYDGGANYNHVVDLSGNPGSYNWTIPNTPSTQCLVRVDAFDAAANEGSDASDNFFTIFFFEDTEPPVVTVTAPNGGETLNVGTVYTITWNAMDNVGVTSTSLYYSYNGGADYNHIGDVSGNPGSYNWTVPNTPSTQCLVRVNAFDAAANEGSDISNAFFAIEAAAQPYVWVQNIDLSIATKGKNTEAVANVLIWDQDNNPVGSAQVSSHWAGLTNDSDVFFTKKKGTGSCSSDKLKDPSGCWDYYVDDVVAAGHIFRGDLGETYDQICTSTALFSASTGFSVSQTNLAKGSAEFFLSLSRTGFVSFDIYNVEGRRVRTLVSGSLPAGSTTLIWDGTNQNGELVPSGIYFCRVVSGDLVETNKMVLMR